MDKRTIRRMFGDNAAERFHHHISKAHEYTEKYHAASDEERTEMGLSELKIAGYHTQIALAIATWEEAIK